MREWLKCVTVAKVVEADETGRTFWLPKNRVAAIMTPWNRNFFNFYPSMAEVYSDILDCFKPTGPSGSL